MVIAASSAVNRYIACQGPLPATCSDFWRMTWEQGSNMVVMLTTQVERGRVRHIPNQGSLSPFQPLPNTFGLVLEFLVVKIKDVSNPHKENRQNIPPLISSDPFVSFQGEVSSVLAQPWCHCYPWGLPGVLCDRRRAISILGQRDNSHTPGGKDHFLYRLSWTDYVNIEHLTKMT
jgi:hypothetical protein